MCDEITNREDKAWLKQHGITRRQFGKYSSLAAMLAALPPVANAAYVVDEDVEIETPDGMADAYWVRPSTGAHAAVILWPDIVGIRTAKRMMGKRLAQSGYAVLVVNPYYRTHRGQVVEDGQTFSTPGVRDMLMPHARSLSPETCVSDGGAFISWLDAQPEVDTSRKVGTMGYCMTGSYVFRLAAAYPDRVGAGASFHGGGLVSDADNSPHKLISRMADDAGILVAIADNDDERQPEAKDVLRASFDDAGIFGEVEVYADAQHGWCPLDSAVYHQAQAERAWNRMQLLFDNHLKS